VITRVGIPSVWESTAVNIRLERINQSFHFPVVELRLH
jgi:hypothetical protein